MLQTTLSSLKKTSKERKKLVKSLNEELSRPEPRSTHNPAVISEYMKDITYIRQLADSNNPAELNEALMALGLPMIDSRNPAVIDEQRRLLYSYLMPKTVSGNPITFKILGNLTPEVTGLKVTMNPIQSGTGDPSPTNIRPITGRTEASVTRTAGEDVETKTHQYSETIYGGVDDFVNGGAESTYGIVDLGTLNWTAINASTGIFYSADVTDEKREMQGITVLSSALTPIANRDSSSTITTDYSVCMYNGVTITTHRVYVKVPTISTPSDLQTYLSGTTLCYPLATPTTISTSADEITLLKGENVLSTDGDSIEVTYKQNFT